MDYYHFVRSEIKPLLPKAPARILEVGAGAGSTLKWLKALNPKTETTAVELNSSLLDQLEQNADVVIIGAVDEQISQLKTYDLILLLDVLRASTRFYRDPSKVFRAIGAGRSRHCFRSQYRPSKRLYPASNATPI